MRRLRSTSGSLRNPVRYLRNTTICGVMPCDAANRAENLCPKRGATGTFPPRRVFIGAHVSADGAKRGTVTSGHVLPQPHA